MATEPAKGPEPAKQPAPKPAPTLAPNTDLRSGDIKAPAKTD